MTWMITCTGREHHFSGHNVFDFDQDQNWLIHEVAHALAQINRFTGHALRPYSVAEHSLLVADLARINHASPSAQLAALLHDAHEAFTGDVSSPVKWHVGTPWRDFEHSQEIPVQNALRVRSASHSHRARISQWDLQALATERRDLLLFDPMHNVAWQILDNPAAPVQPSTHHKLNTPEREAMTWRDWRDAFLQQYHELYAAMRREAGAVA